MVAAAPPDGKVQSWLRVHRIGSDDYAVDVDPGHGAAVVTRLRRFLLRTKAEIGEPERRFVLARRHGADRVELGREPEGVAAAAGVLAGVVVGPGVAGVDRILRLDATADDAAARRRSVATWSPRRRSSGIASPTAFPPWAPS